MGRSEDEAVKVCAPRESVRGLAGCGGDKNGPHRRALAGAASRGARWDGTDY